MRWFDSRWCIKELLNCKWNLLYLNFCFRLLNDSFRLHECWLFLLLNFYKLWFGLDLNLRSLMNRRQRNVLRCYMCFLLHCTHRFFIELTVFVNEIELTNEFDFPWQNCFFNDTRCFKDVRYLVELANCGFSSAIVFTEILSDVFYVELLKTKNEK